MRLGVPGVIRGVVVDTAFFTGRALERFLDHVQAREAVWLARRIEIAEHWRHVHPPTA